MCNPNLALLASWKETVVNTLTMDGCMKRINLILCTLLLMLSSEASEVRNYMEGKRPFVPQGRKTVFTTFKQR
jgi:hypothetical protein